MESVDQIPADQRKIHIRGKNNENTQTNLSGFGNGIPARL
jgi:hypothetical protein